MFGVLFGEADGYVPIGVVHHELPIGERERYVVGHVLYLGTFPQGFAAEGSPSGSRCLSFARRMNWLGTLAKGLIVALSSPKKIWVLTPDDPSLEGMALVKEAIQGTKAEK